VDWDFVVFLVVAAVVLLGRLLKKATEAGGRDAARTRGQPPDYRASAQEIKEFLRNLQRGRQPAAQVPAPAAQAPGELVVPIEMLEPSAPVLETQPVAVVRPAAAGLDIAPVLEVPAEARPVARVRRRKPPDRARARPKRAPVAATPVQAPKEGPVPAAAAAAAAVAAAGMPVALRRLGLREAVVWSEVLGPPLGLRRLRGRGAPGQRV
jgi:hypothetical protein